MTTATDLMTEFVERTGESRRYLWTDGFAVCNLLGSGDTARALALIDRVHRTLGRHREDDLRRGWISGLPEDDGAAHPTLGGLRIGKPLPERPRGAPIDDRQEWDRDGQYFHYLTKWMHALDQTARVTGDPRHATWARELADTAHRRFVYTSHGAPAMHWKMSIDLMRPQVASMGQHDPLDGYVTTLQLGRGGAPDLEPALADYRAMLAPRELATTDPLGLGGLLFDAYRLAQLDSDRALRDSILAAARVGFAHYVHLGGLAAPASRRLAFRELGLAIGLVAAERMEVTGFAHLRGVRDAILSCWTNPQHRALPVYVEHRDINDVMLATALAPDGFLVLRRGS